MTAPYAAENRCQEKRGIQRAGDRLGTNAGSVVPEIRQDFEKNDVQTMAYGDGPQDRHHCFILPYASSPPKPPKTAFLHLHQASRGKREERRPPERRSSMSCDLHVMANPSRASRSLRNVRLPVMPCALPSPSTIITAMNHLSSNRPRIATRSSSNSSSSSF